MASKSDGMELVLEQQEALQAAARSRLYDLLAQGFRDPTLALHEAVCTDQFWDEMEAHAAQLPHNLDVEATMTVRLDWKQLEAQYVRLFDVGGPNPNTDEWQAPCHLYEGEYGGGRMKVMADALRFYHHFGLQLAHAKGNRDRPDHLAIELEFLHWLTFKEAELSQQQKGAEVLTLYRMAQRDFLRVHLAGFLGEVAEKVTPRGIPFYSDLARLGEQFCSRELSHLARLLQA